MLEQIHAPSEDARKVQIFVSAATTVFGVATSLNAGLLNPVALLGTALAIMGAAGVLEAAARLPRLD